MNFSIVEGFFTLQYCYKNKLDPTSKIFRDEQRKELCDRILQLNSTLDSNQLAEKYFYVWREFNEQILSSQQVSDDQLKKVLENSESQLGRTTDYKDKYDPTLLFPVSRQESRDRIGKIDYEFEGLDVWNAYEFSGLDNTGKPFSKILQIAYDCKSENIVESKSLKLYLNSFNQTNSEEALPMIERDLKELLKTDTISVKTKDVNIDTEFNDYYLCIDDEVTEGFEYKYNPGLLVADLMKEGEMCTNISLYSNLLKSNCRHTKQPDWGSVYIDYIPSNKKLDPTSLLKYIVSFRGHNEFHEECCERILYDLKNLLNPLYLKVQCKYTRRGGIDINPIRVYNPKGIHERYSFEREVQEFVRTIRQ